MNTSLKAKILFTTAPRPLWYAVPDNFGGLKIGSLVEAPLKNSIKIGLVVEISQLPLSFPLKNLERNLSSHFTAETKWLDLLEWLSQYYHCSMSRVLYASLPKGVQKFISNPKVSKEEEESKYEENILLQKPNLEQASAVKKIKDTLLAPEKAFHSFLLHGITGSGKTLVYLESAKCSLNQGKSVLFLLPEIALTVQIIQRIEQHLQRPVYSYHSNMGVKEKRKFWQALKSDEAAAFVGVRSMILLPLKNIGLVVVDEEHDSSYKQTDSQPKYNARDVALYRARQFKAVAVLGSATPSLESYYLAKQGKHTLLTLEKRATDSRLPQIHLVNMREQMELQGDHPLSIPLREALKNCLHNGEQAILLLNRRGLAKKRICKSCGNIQTCKKCINPLIPHKQHQRLICHCCGYSLPIQAPCGLCHSNDCINQGVAIEKLEEELALLFPDSGVLRLDRDSVARVGAAEKILSDFRNHKADILLGTQMVAKGHDFPKVNLVGVIDADSGLGIPDFRAQEKLFQLVTQVAGRAGRHSNRGEVFLQSFNPENPVMNLALDQNYIDFYDRELILRSELSYPPYSRVFKVEFKGKNPESVRKSIALFGEALKKSARLFQLEILGPAEAIFSKQKDYYRWQVFGKGRQFSQIKKALQQAFKETEASIPSSVNFNVDMDPVHLL